MYPFEKLLVWKRAHALAVLVYRITVPWRDFGMHNQVRRAAELRSHVLLARGVGLRDRLESDPLEGECEPLRRMLTALRKRVIERESTSKR